MPLALDIMRQREAQKKLLAGEVPPPTSMKATAPAPARAPAAPAILDPVAVRAQVIEQRRLRIEKRLHTMAYERGQLLFEGQWGCAEFVRRAYRRMWLRSLLCVVDCVLVTALLLGTAGFLGLLLALVIGLDLSGK